MLLGTFCGIAGTSSGFWLNDVVACSWWYAITWPEPDTLTGVSTSASRALLWCRLAREKQGSSSSDDMLSGFRMQAPADYEALEGYPGVFVCVRVGARHATHV